MLSGLTPGQAGAQHAAPLRGDAIRRGSKES